MPPKTPATANPLQHTYRPPPNSLPTASTHPSALSHPPTISQETHHIAGILTTVHGLAELPAACTQLCVLWLLHPRLQSQESMAALAAHLIHSYNEHTREQRAAQGHDRSIGMIAVSFDQRNHGTRLVDARANEAWRSGNPNHGPDMFSQYAGTALDTSMLLDYLPAYILPGGERTIVRNMVVGISLGAHAGWHVLMNDARFSAGIVVVGCPDYARLMLDRARLSKRASWTETGGKGFVGSRDWGWGLVEAVSQVDPASRIGRLLGRSGWERGEVDWEKEMSTEEEARVRPSMQEWLGGKRMLLLNGGEDKLVGYKHSVPFLRWLKKSIGKGGWWEGGMELEDVVFEGVGHEVPPVMIPYILGFVNETMDKETDSESGPGRREAKI